MTAFPAKTTLADTYPNPSNAGFRAGIAQFYDATTGLLGTTGNAVDARNALGIGSVFSFRNLLINGNFAINQRGYVSGAATGTANQYTLDRWRIVTLGQSAAFGGATPDRSVTFPAGGGEQVVEGETIVGGTYTLSWIGAGTAKVNGAAVTNGGNVTLPANTNATVQFVGAVGQVQLELGPVATPFERRPLVIELSMCQRYYETGSAQISGYGPTGVDFINAVPYKVSKRASPTVGYTPTTNINVFVFDVLAVDAYGARIRAQTGSTGGFYFISNFTANAEL